MGKVTFKRRREEKTGRRTASKDLIKSLWDPWQLEEKEVRRTILRTILVVARGRDL